MRHASSASASARALVGALIAAGLHPRRRPRRIDLLHSYELALQSTTASSRSPGRAPTADARRCRRPMPSCCRTCRSRLPTAETRTGPEPRQRHRADPVFPSRTGSLTLRQPIFRLEPVLAARASQSESAGRRCAARQRLPGDWACDSRRAYFEALFARDSLDLISAQKASYEAQLRAAKLAFGAGTGTRTDIDDIQARYDLLLADEIRARQAIGAATQQLEIFVGEPITACPHSTRRASVADAHDPGALKEWLDRAVDLQPRPAHAESALGRGGRGRRDGPSRATCPTLDLVVQHNDSMGDSNNTFPRTENKTGYVGVQLNVPIYAGGDVNSTVRQATAAAEEARAAYEYSRDDLRLKVKQNFDALKAGHLPRARAGNRAGLSRPDRAVEQEGRAGRHPHDARRAHGRAAALQHAGRPRQGALPGARRLGDAACPTSATSTPSASRASTGCSKAPYRKAARQTTAIALSIGIWRSANLCALDGQLGDIFFGGLQRLAVLDDLAALSGERLPRETRPFGRKLRALRARQQEKLAKAPHGNAATRYRARQVVDFGIRGKRPGADEGVEPIGPRPGGGDGRVVLHCRHVLQHPSARRAPA